MIASLLLMAMAASSAPVAPKPLYRDPVHDGAADASTVYDKATGDVVWEMELPGGTTAAPMSYMVDQKQYIVVTVGWDDMPSEYVALALP